MTPPATVNGTPLTPQFVALLRQREPGLRGGGTPAAAAPQPRQEPPPARRRQRPDGDTVIRLLTAAVVLAVATFAAIVSYSHIYFLGRHNGQDGTAARMLPLSVDGLIAAASLVMLHAARKKLGTPWLARVGLGLGVGATVAANVAYGLPFGWLAAVVSAWPAVAFIVSVELAVRFVRDAREAATAATADRTGGRTGCGTETGAEGGTEAPSAQAGTDSGEDGMPGRRPGRDRRQRSRRPPSARARAVAILRRSPELSDADVAKKTGVSERTVQRAREDLAGGSRAAKERA